MSYEKYKEHAAICRQLISDEGDALIEEMFKLLFEQYPNFMGAAVLGSTPSWNDGDSCEHSSEIDFSYWDHVDSVEIDELEENDMDEDIENSVYMAIDEELIEKIHGTDYCVVAWRNKDGSIGFESKGYDCGY
jgi:hypothetical protein